MIFDVDFSNQWSYGIPCGWSENHPVLWHKTWIIKICQNPNQFIWTWLLDVHFVSWWSLHVWLLNHLFEWLLSSESTWYSTSSILSENAPVMAIIFRRQTTGVLFWPKKHVGYQSYINHMCVCLNIGYIPNIYQPFNEENSDKPFGHFGDPSSHQTIWWDLIPLSIASWFDPSVIPVVHI